MTEVGNKEWLSLKNEKIKDRDEWNEKRGIIKGRRRRGYELHF